MRLWLEETLAIEASGGLLVSSGERRRTPGGVFFYLVKGRLPLDLRRRLFPYWPKTRKGASASKPSPPALRQPLTPEELRALLPALFQAQGEVTTVKITLIGRPGQLEKRDDLVITTMTHSGKLPTLPKGLPPWPDTPTTYVVYIAAKQWKKVEEAIANPNDVLLIEGQCAFDPALGQLAVYTTSVTTKLQQRAKREQGGGPGQATPQASQGSDTQAEVQAVTEEISAEEKAKRLEALKQAEQAAVERLKAIQALPASERTGLMTAMKELQRIRDEMKALEG